MALKTCVAFGLLCVFVGTVSAQPIEPIPEYVPPAPITIGNIPASPLPEPATIEEVENPDQLILIMPDGWQLMTNPSVVGDWGPGSALRQRIAELAPGVPVDPFADFHHAALSRIRAEVSAMQEPEYRPWQREASDLQALTNLYREIQQLLIQISAPLTDSSPQRERLADIMQMRLLEPGQALPLFALEYQGTGTPNGKPINVPFSSADEPLHRPFRRVRFTAHLREGADPGFVRFRVSAESPVKVLHNANCQGEEPILCLVNTDGGEASLTLEYTEPEIGENIHTITPYITAEVQSMHGEGRWQTTASDSWAQSFAACDRQLIRDVDLLATEPHVIGEKVQDLVSLMDGVPGLPGERLFSGPQYAAKPNWSKGGAFMDLGMEGDIDNLEPDPKTQEMVALLDELVAMRMSDDYLAANVDQTNNLYRVENVIRQLQRLRGCDQQTLETIQTVLSTQKDRVEKQYQYWRPYSNTASWAAYEWTQRVDYHLQNFDDLRMSDPIPQEELPSALLQWAGGQAGSGLSNIMSLMTLPVASAEKLNSGLSILSAIAETYKVTEALWDLDTLYDIEAELNEAQGWMEMATYFSGVADRYERAFDTLSELESVVSETIGRNCACWEAGE